MHPSTHSAPFSGELNPEHLPTAFNEATPLERGNGANSDKFDGDAPDTICAIATAPGAGGIAIVRASGPRSRELLEAAFRPAHDKPLEPRALRYGSAVDGAGDVLDEVLAVWLPGPSTYTREDMFEIHCHGGSVCARRVLLRLTELGARVAEPGEFTKRAFLNGRIDLSRAEAVMALIGANSEAAARASLRQLEGGVSGFVREVADKLKSSLALIEACTDFPDEVDEPDAARQVLETIRAQRTELNARCDERCVRLIREGASIVLAGRPNVGKSSLMNALLRQERAIVTEIPGTTRDVLTERLSLGGIVAELSDTAGQRATQDPVERIGVERATRAMKRADIVLIVLDASQPRTPEDEALLSSADERAIICLNKCDLPPVSDYPNALHLSAATGEGIESLLSEMERRLSADTLEETRMTQERHLRLARLALEALDAAERAILSSVPLDLVSIDLQRALSALSEITGENATEEVITAIFSTFCVGK